MGMTSVVPKRIRGLFVALGALWVLASSACNADTSSRADDPMMQGAGGAGAGGNPNTAFLMRPIPDAQHLDVTETCPDGMRDGKRCIPDRVLARPAVCYSGYRVGQNPNLNVFPSEAQVKEDLDLLVRANYSFLRLFDATQHAATVLKVITDNHFDIKLQLGVWIKGPKATQDAANQAEISRAVALATQYPDVIVGVSVGNETLDSWSSVLTPPADLAEYITQVRGAITQPVTTDDLYPPLELQSGYQDVLTVLQAVDYLSVHVYAAIDASFSGWDFGQINVPAGPGREQAMMMAAQTYTKKTIQDVRKVLTANNLDLPIVIGEAGWKSRVTDHSKVAEPWFAHEVNQEQFFAGLEAWTYGAARDADSAGTAFYFEAFDEPWKTSDDGWGLFDTQRNAKYVMWSQFPDLTPPGAPAYTAGDALYFQ